MKCTKIFGYVLLVLLFISTVPNAAEAGAVRIYPDQFKPVNPSDPHNSQTPSRLYGNGGDATYYAIVNLPIGKKVTRLVLFHSSFDAGAYYNYVSLYRFQRGLTENYQREMAKVYSMDYTGSEVISVSTTTISYPKVKGGFTYWVEVDVGMYKNVHGVKVGYE